MVKIGKKANGKNGPSWQNGQMAKMKKIVPEFKSMNSYFQVLDK